MTIELFREDAYLQECTAKVISINSDGAYILDQTVFYPNGGGQPGDSGQFEFDGQSVEISDTLYDRDTKQILHIPAIETNAIKVGDSIHAKINWSQRYLHMRMHTALHLMCSAIPCGVTGGQIGAVKSRLDFDIGDYQLDKDSITSQIQQLIAAALPVTCYWISDLELDENPELVRTMSVQPPRGSGKIRLLKVGDDTDLQPCGGTHVKNTAEIGNVVVSKIENKGKKNRRVHLVFG